MKVSFKDENISIKVSHLYTYGTDNPSRMSKLSNLH